LSDVGHTTVTAVHHTLDEVDTDTAVRVTFVSDDRPLICILDISDKPEEHL